MKKIFLFVAALTLSLTSCSSDDNSGGNGGNGNSVLKVTINGVQKTFNSVVVNKNTETYDGETWVELRVTATINNDPSEMITFYVDEGDVGAYTIWSFEYSKDATSFSTNGGDITFSSVVQTNSNGKLKGTFTGSLSSWSNQNQEYTYITTTNGSFDISY